MPANKQYDDRDRGIIGKNNKRKTETQPSHTGKVTLSQDTLDGLYAALQDGADAVLYLSGWPTKTPGMLSLAVNLPMEKNDAPPQRTQRAYSNQTQGGGQRRISEMASPRRGPPPQQRQQQFVEETGFDDAAPW